MRSIRAGADVAANRPDPALPRVGLNSEARPTRPPMARFQYVTQIEIDPGAVRLLPQECALAGMKKPLVVTDAGVRAAGVLDLALAAMAGLDYAVFDQTPGNPNEAAVRAATAVYLESHCDGLVAVGGG